jgi:hypothetical protein
MITTNSVLFREQSAAINLLPEAQKQILLHRIHRSIQRGYIAPEIFKAELSFVTGLTSFGANEPTFQHYLLELQNAAIASLWFELHATYPRTKVLNIHQAEQVIQALTAELAEARTRDFDQFTALCETFDGRESIRIQHEAWIAGLCDTNPIPKGLTVPQEYEPHLIYQSLIQKEKRAGLQITCDEFELIA